jgi:hypothetical protein
MAKQIPRTAERCAAFENSTSRDGGVSHLSSFSDFIFRLVIILCFFLSVLLSRQFTKEMKA